VQLDLLSTNKEELVGAQDPEKSEERGQQSTKPGLQESRCQFFRFQKLLGGITWGAALKGRGTRESWQVFKVSIFQVQEWDTPILRETCGCMRQLAWLIRDVMAELQCKTGSILEAEAGAGYKG